MPVEHPHSDWLIGRSAPRRHPTTSHLSGSPMATAKGTSEDSRAVRFRRVPKERTSQSGDAPSQHLLDRVLVMRVQVKHSIVRELSVVAGMVGARQVHGHLLHDALSGIVQPLLASPNRGGRGLHPRTRMGYLLELGIVSGSSPRLPQLFVQGLETCDVSTLSMPMLVTKPRNPGY